MQVDNAEIERALSLILEPGQVTELRCLDAETRTDRRPHVESGYFDDVAKMVAAVGTITKAKGSYFIPNPVNPALKARAANRVRPPGKEPTTSDHDVAARKWLLIDCDPKRPAGISASDHEHDAAIERAKRIRTALSSEGWPDSILADSGNGAHLLYRIDLPVDDDGLVKRSLEALAQQFDDDVVTVDQAVFNPARIWKLYGTPSGKGDSTPDRPHRLSRIIEAPAVLVPVNTGLLLTLAGPESSGPTTATAHNGYKLNGSTYTGPSIDAGEWLRKYGIEANGPHPYNGGQKWILPVCPWNDSHTNDAAFVIQQASGALAAGCRHDGCRGKGWRDLRTLFEPKQNGISAKVAPIRQAELVMPAARAPFPIDALPPVVRRYATEAARAIGCEISYVTLPLLACLARAIGNTRSIALKRSWVELAIIWGAIVGKSGTHKSPALSVATSILNRRQQDAIASHTDELVKFDEAKAVYERDYSVWKRSKSTEPPPWQPEKPHCRRYVCGDVTIEALVDRLAGQDDGVLVVRDELAGWLDGQAEYKGGKGSDTGHWLATWSGAPLTVDRKTGPRPMIHVPRASVSIVGGIQPGILRRALGREHLVDGMCARVLFVMPEPKQVTWTDLTVSPETEAEMVKVFERLLTLEPAADEEGHAAPYAMQLSAHAKATWIEYYNRHRAEMTDLDDNLAAAWSKLEAYSARFALVHQLCQWAEDDGSDSVVDEASILAGIALSDWFASEARRVYELLGETPEQGELRELSELIARKGGTITARKLAHASTRYRAPGEAETALEMLAKAGGGHWQTDTNTGGRPASVFVLSNASNATEVPESSSFEGVPLPDHTHNGSHEGTNGKSRDDLNLMLLAEEEEGEHGNPM